jgi:rhodanese-related sulfurtransferase
MKMKWGPGMNKITAEQLNNDLMSETITIFDVRGDVDYEKEHIPGAKTSPLGSLIFRIVRVMNPESKIAVYSKGPGCKLAINAVERLENLGMLNVHYLAEGISGWKAAGFPVESSVSAKQHTHGPSIECRSIVVDRERAYGGAFKGDPVDTEGAGG